MDQLSARKWLARWDAQQERYIAHREERFAVIGDVLAQATSTVAEPLIVDLGCGPGSLSARIAERLPAAEIIGMDMDPLLLALARSGYRHVTRFVEADLRLPGWTDLLGLDRKLDAAMSTTALHYFPASLLAGLYRQLAHVMRPGAVFVNADNLYDEQPSIAELAAVVRRGRSRLDNEDWGSWWRAVEADPALADLLSERTRKIGEGGQDHHLSVREHTELLHEAGFREIGTVWQTGDDVVLVAVR
ncbi:class I SAM-dependent methyltransferase [Nonomuraea sp. JJY05]|jgi:trans-aconitate methyltransferase|uniref:class I SAM-dependent methyltransferase n=1 Tax=Nonomuraea sp. JJY05 TaxID=3350255 RepID=UPI00373E53F7